MKPEHQNHIILSCQQLLNKMALLLDQSRWDELAQCYTEDALLYRPSDPETAISGRDNILASFKERPSRQSCHLISNTVFEQIQEDSVEVISRVWLVSAPPSEEQPAISKGPIMVGSFCDTLVNHDGRWLVKIRKGSIEIKLE